MSFLVSKRSPSFVDPLDPDAGSLAVECPFLRGAATQGFEDDFLSQYLIPDKIRVPGTRIRKSLTQVPHIETDPIGDVEIGALPQGLDPMGQLANKTFVPELIVQRLIYSDGQ